MQNKTTIEIEKPIVPQWFDEWYKTFNNNGGNNAQALYYLNRTGWGHALIDGNECEVVGYYDKLEDLLGEYGYGNAKEYLSKAILFGYEVKSEPLYYAKIKGWDYLAPSQCFWSYIPEYGEYIVGSKVHSSFHLTELTMEEWNELGINDTNADFEKVEQ